MSPIHEGSGKSTGASMSEFTIITSSLPASPGVEIEASSPEKMASTGKTGNETQVPVVEDPKLVRRVRGMWPRLVACEDLKDHHARPKHGAPFFPNSASSNLPSLSKSEDTTVCKNLEKIQSELVSRLVNYKIWPLVVAPLLQDDFAALGKRAHCWKYTWVEFVDEIISLVGPGDFMYRQVKPLYNIRLITSITANSPAKDIVKALLEAAAGVPSSWQPASTTVHMVERAFKKRVPSAAVAMSAYNGESIKEWIATCEKKLSTVDLGMNW